MQTKSQDESQDEYALWTIDLSDYELQHLDALADTNSYYNRLCTVAKVLSV